MKIPEWQSRTQLLIGTENIIKLSSSHVLVAGLGGVGGYAAEQLCRAGVGELTLVDNDTVHSSNRNRQIIALKSSENILKINLFEQRFKDINPSVKIHVFPEFIEEKNTNHILQGKFDYVVDAIDTLTPKVNLLEKAFIKKMKIVSSMGSGGKTDPRKIRIADISESNHCKFAYIVRKYLHRKGIFEGIKVVYSPEPVPKNAFEVTNGENNKRSIIGTISYMPAIFGCYCAYTVITDLINSRKD